MDTVYSVPVPERLLPLVYRTLAEALEEGSVAVREGGIDGGILAPDSAPTVMGWTEEEVALAYRESTLKQKRALDYLADHPNKGIGSLELAQEVYPDENNEVAEGRLYGVLGSLGTRVKNTYGKDKWFFHATRRSEDSSLGHMVYTMPTEVAKWVKRASGQPDPE